jgi:formiminoglutamate deiminase
MPAMESRKLHFTSALLPVGWREHVTLSLDAAGMITAVASGEAQPATVKGLAVAAMPNLHSHAHQRLMLGLAERAGPGADSFWTWREVMYGFALKLSPDDLRAVAAQLYVEMLKAGFTTVGEFQYLHHQPDGRPYANRAELSLACVAAAEMAGLGVTMLPTLYNFGGFGGQPTNPGQRRFLNDAAGFQAIYAALQQELRGHPLARLGIAPHSLRAVTPDLLREVLDGIGAGAPVHIHIAEQTREVDDCLAWSGQRPVDYLLNHFEVSSRWCAIHATHMTEAETLALASRRVIAGLCPTTEANLGDGIFPATTFLKAGGAFGIGSDSQISVSPAEDLRLLEYSQRLRDRTRNALADGPGQSTGRSLYQRALAGGAQALAQPVGALAVGYRADITVLDADCDALMGRSADAALDSWIFSGGNSCVKDVFVAGRQVIADRHHAAEADIARSFRSTLERLAA